ncbi:MAG: hypothetical protein ABII02_00210 [Candidatus Magasanikbacteria bacterium]
MRKQLFSVWSLLVVCIIITASFLYIAKPVWEIAGDGHGYYIYARSLYFDGDLNFENEYERYDRIYGSDLVEGVRQSTGRHGNPFAIGKSIVLFGFFFIAVLVENFFGQFSPDMLGFSRYYEVSMALGSIFCTLLGVFFLYKSLQYFFSERASWASTFVVLFASPLFHYIVYEPHMSHGVSFAGMAVLFFLCSKIYYEKHMTFGVSTTLGVIMGLVALVRWQNILFFVLPLSVLIWLWRKQGVRFLYIISPFIISFLFFLPQLVVWKHLYGFWLGVPQGDTFIDVFHPKLFEVFFSPFHGLFIWHPLLLLGVLGLLISFRKNNIVSIPLLIGLLLQVYLNASLIDWWGGSAFGARKMIGSLFIFGYGFSFLFDHVQKRKYSRYALMSIIILSFAWNSLLMLSAARGHLSMNDPVTYSQVFKAPIQLLK